MDEGTATVIASVVAASGSVAVAWITSRPKQAPPPAYQPAPVDSRPAPMAGGASDWATSSPPPLSTMPIRNTTSNHIVAKSFLYFLYFLTTVLVIVCGAENDIDQPDANLAAGFAILFGVAAWFIRKRVKAMPRA